jgi:hypothetical protein
MELLPAGVPHEGESFLECVEHFLHPEISFRDFTGGFLSSPRVTLPQLFLCRGRADYMSAQVLGCVLNGRRRDCQPLEATILNHT